MTSIRQDDKYGLAIDDSSPLVIRLMRPVDIPAVMAIERVSFPLPWPESAYRYEIRSRPDSRFYVLETQTTHATAWPERLLRRDVTAGQVLGYIGLRRREDAAHIATFAIHTHWRRRGLGEYLLLATIDHALDEGVQQVTLEVRASNRAAQALYAKLGFVETGRRRAYYKDGEDARLMALGPLNGANAAHLRQQLYAAQERLALEVRWDDERGDT